MRDGGEPIISESDIPQSDYSLAYRISNLRISNVEAKKNPPPKPRAEEIYATTLSDATELVVRINRQGDFGFGQPMTNVYSQVSYERPKGAKSPLSRVPLQSSTPMFEIQRAVLKNFDYLVAVDTNTRIINTRNVSVTAVVTFKEASPPPGARAYWKLDVPFSWEFFDLRTDKIENLGWIAALGQLYAAGHVTQGTRIGMIVDSDLGNIPAFNRTLPVFEQSVLPAGVQSTQARTRGART